MTFIAYNYDNYPISIVIATDIKLANAYWQGADVPVHSHKCVEEDFIPLNEHPTGVFPILKTIVKRNYDFRPGADILTVNK